MLQVEVIKPNELTQTDLAAWDLFRRETPAFHSPLLAAEFAQAVGRVREDAAIAVYRKGGRAVGFFAHHRRPGGLARPIGAPWSDYQALVSAPDAGLDGEDALRAAGLGAFRFTGLIDPFNVFEAAPGEAREAYVIAPEEGGEAYWEVLRAASPKRFKNIRRLEHKLEREQGELTFGADTDAEAFARILSWKRDQLRRSGLHDVLAPDWVQALMSNLFQTRDGALQGLFLTLRVAGRPIAGHFGVRIGGDYHPWIAAYDPELSAYSPGMSFMSEAIRAMPSLGLTTYDLSGGSDHYKKPFASSSTLVREGTLGRSELGLKGPLRRIQRRLDHIATTELSLQGRVQGLAAALAASSRRLSQQSGEG